MSCHCLTSAVHGIYFWWCDFGKEEKMERMWSRFPRNEEEFERGMKIWYDKRVSRTKTNTHNQQSWRYSKRLIHRHERRHVSSSEKRWPLRAAKTSKGTLKCITGMMPMIMMPSLVVFFLYPRNSWKRTTFYPFQRITLYGTFSS